MVEGERLCEAFREMVGDYIPQTPESRYIKIPTVKSVAGKDLAVIAESQRDVYREIQEVIKKERLSKRDS